jgi:hypothetical protein
MTSRTQYLTFATIWAVAVMATVIIAMSYELDMGDNFNGWLIVFGFLALGPAAVGFVLVRKGGSLIDRWRVKRGTDVYQERKYQDASGFIHLNEVSSCEQQEEIRLGEIVRGMGPMILNQTLDESDDSE